MSKEVITSEPKSTLPYEKDEIILYLNNDADKWGVLPYDIANIMYRGFTAFDCVTSLDEYSMLSVFAKEDADEPYIRFITLSKFSKYKTASPDDNIAKAIDYDIDRNRWELSKANIKLVSKLI